MGGSDDEAVEVSAARLQSVVRQLADLRVIADRLAEAARAEAPALVPGVLRLRDGFGAVGVQIQALRRRGDGPAAGVRELRPRGEDEQ